MNRPSPNGTVAVDDRNDDDDLRPKAREVSNRALVRLPSVKARAEAQVHRLCAERERERERDRGGKRSLLAFLEEGERARDQKKSCWLIFNLPVCFFSFFRLGEQRSSKKGIQPSRSSKLSSSGSCPNLF